jgi:hypothetical protein
MQRFIYATTLTAILTSTSLATASQASNFGASRITHSAAYPNRVKVTSATYRVGIQVGSDSLSELRLIVPEDAPGNLRIGRITIANAAGQSINANSSFDGKEITIAFVQPVTAGTLLEIGINGVRTSDLLGRTWLFPIYGRNAGTNQLISLGTARIQTYK